MRRFAAILVQRFTSGFSRKTLFAMRHTRLAILAALFLSVCVSLCVPRGFAQTHSAQTPKKASQPQALKLAAVKMGDKWGYINTKGKMVIAPQFDFAHDFYEGLAGVEIDKKWGYIDKTGKMVIAPQSGFGLAFSEGRARVCVDHKWGFIDKTGKMVVAPQYDQAFDFAGGLAFVSNEKWKWGYIDPAGTMVIPQQFEDEDRYSSRFSEQLAAVGLDDKWGYIDKTGRFVIAAQFYSGLPFSEHLARVKGDHKWGYIDHSGTMVISLPNDQYEELGYFHEQRALADVHQADKEHSLRGYIDTTGKMVIAPQFKPVDDRDQDNPDFAWNCYYVGNFSEGLAAVTLGEKWGYIDATGKMVITPQFDDARDFYGGLAAVEIGKKWGFINKTGQMVIAPQFDMQQCGFKD